MVVPNLYAFLKNPQNFVHSFSELANLTQEVKTDQLVTRKNIVQSFIRAVPQAFTGLQQKNLLITERDWQKFDRSFADILAHAKDRQNTLETVFRIQSATGKRFQFLPGSFCPIRITCPQGQPAIVSKESLNSDVLQRAFSGQFSESKSREISLHGLSSAGFDILVSFLQNNPVDIPPEHLQEILEFSYMYAMPDLFAGTFSVVLKSLNAEGIKSEGLQKTCDFLCNLLGINPKKFLSKAAQQTSLQLSASQESSDRMVDALEQFYRQFAPKNDATRNLLLNCIYSLGDQIRAGCYDDEREKNIGMELIKWAASKGSPEAQNWLGIHYECYCRDNKTAVVWYTEAAVQGYAPAQYSLAECYQKGNGVQEDHTKAVALYTKAALGGSVHAQYRLAYGYKDGEDGFEKDQALAIVYYKLAAAQQFSFAQFDLAECYEKGISVQQDLKKALKWYLKALKNEDSRAYLKICELAEKGVCVDLRDAELASLCSMTQRLMSYNP